MASRKFVTLSVDFSLALPELSIKHAYSPSPPAPVRYLSVEEEIAFGPANW